jgi:hypothetical protein
MKPACASSPTPSTVSEPSSIVIFSTHHPELNPIEYLRGYARGNDLAGFAPKQLWELQSRGTQAFARVRKVKRCLRAFWIQSDLNLEGL